MNKAARNERVKITANWFNGAAIAAVAVGGFAPATSYILSASPYPVLMLNAVFAGWLLISIGLHLGARLILRGIEE